MEFIDLHEMESKPVSQTKERLTSNDALWLIQPHAVVCGIYSFASNLRKEELVKLFQDKLDQFPRFSSKVVPEDGHMPYWEIVSPMNVSEHFYEYNLFEGGKAALRKQLLEISNSSMDMTRPLWDVHLIHLEDNKSIFVVRVHHCISDGQGLLRMTSIFSDEPQPIAPYEAVPSQNATFRESLRAMGSALGMVWRILFKRPDTLSPIKKKDPIKIFGVDWLDTPFNFAEINRIRSFVKGKRASINDVLLVILSGGIRHYLKQRGIPLSEIIRMQMHCVMPVAIPKRSGSGNNIATVQVLLPIEIESPIERLRIIKERMNDIKRSPQALISSTFNRIGPYLPRWLTNWLYAGLEESTSVFMSNVRGPDVPLTMCGHVLENFMWFGRPFDKIDVSFPMVSYGGKMNIVFLYDTELINAENLKYCLMKSYLELLSHHS